MRFNEREFGLKFRNYLRRQFERDHQAPSREKQAKIWEALASDPLRIQSAIEHEYALHFGGRRVIELIPELLHWLIANWDVVLKILLTLLVLILEDDKRDE